MFEHIFRKKKGTLILSKVFHYTNSNPITVIKLIRFSRQSKDFHIWNSDLTGTKQFWIIIQTKASRDPQELVETTNSIKTCISQSHVHSRSFMGANWLTQPTLLRWADIFQTKGMQLWGVLFALQTHYLETFHFSSTILISKLDKTMHKYKYPNININATWRICFLYYCSQYVQNS